MPTQLGPTIYIIDREKSSYLKSCHLEVPLMSGSSVAAGSGMFPLMLFYCIGIAVKCELFLICSVTSAYALLNFVKAFFN